MTSITTINSGDLISNSRTDINNNFANLNSGKIESSYLDTDTSLTADSDSKIPTQKAVKAYVDSGGNPNASETVRGLVQEATDAQVTAGTATGSTGAKLFVTPAKLATRLPQATDVQVFSTPGSFTWTKPTGARLVEVFTIGGGGGASGGYSIIGSGGGGGALSTLVANASLFPATATVVVGAGGAGGYNSNPGIAGGASSFNGVCVAGGGGANYEGTGGVGGTSTIAANGVSGGNGSAAGGGGGAAGASATTITGGIAGTHDSVLGAGGNGTLTGGGTGSAGSSYGGGGGGAKNPAGTGGGGAGGYVRVTTYF